MTLILLQQFQVVVHLVYVQVAVSAQELTALTVILNVPGETILEQADVDLAERALLLLWAPSALVEVALSIFVAKGFPAVVGTIKLAHVDQVVNVAGDLHLLELPFAVGAKTVPRQPLV